MQIASWKYKYKDICKYCLVDNVETQVFPVTAHFFLFLFTILVSIILMNLLVGLAVSDIQGLNKSARLHQLLQQVIVILKWKYFRLFLVSLKEDILNHSKNFGEFASQIGTLSKIMIFEKNIAGKIVRKPTCELSYKISTRSVRPFWRLLDTNRQTDKQSI